MTLILRHSDIAALIDRAEVYRAVEQAHADLSTGTASNPAPVKLPLAKGGAAIPMAAAVRSGQASSVKLLSDLPHNRQHGLPTQRSTIMMMSTVTGECEAILDGRVITAVRTAAASAVATAHLSRANGTTLGLVGAGTLAVEHARAIAAVREIEKILVWSRSSATIDAFRRRISDLAVSVEQAGSPRDVASASDILCTLTPSKTPVVEGGWFHPGMHINAVGAPPRPDHREIDGPGMKIARLVVDSRSTALSKSGDILLAIADGAITEADVDLELGDVVVDPRVGRHSDDDVTLFNSVGIGLQDLVAARLLVDRALANGVGTTVNLQT